MHKRLISHVTERDRRASWRKLAEAVAQEVGFATSLHMAALDAVRSKVFETPFHTALGTLQPDVIDRIWARVDEIDAKKCNPSRRKVAR